MPMIRLFRRLAFFVMGLMVLYALIATVGYATPFSENADEVHHLRVVRFIVAEGRLPTPADETLPPRYQLVSQYSQPPLTYLIGAFFAADVALPELHPLTPNPLSVGTQPQDTYFIHPPNQPLPPDLVRLRYLMVGMGIVAIGLIALAAYELFPLDPHAPIFAAGLFALFPANVALVSWFNNDAPLLLWGALFAWGWARWISHKRFGFGAMLLATLLAALTKQTGLALAPALCLALGMRYRPNGFGARAYGVALLGGVGGIVGYGYWRCGAAVCRTYWGWSANPILQDSSTFWASLSRPQLFLTGIWHFIRTLTIPTLLGDYAAPTWLYLAVFALVLVGCRVNLRVLWPLTFVWITLFALVFARMWYLQTSYMAARYFAVGFPLLALILTAGYSHLFQRWRWIMLGVWLTIALISPPLTHWPIFRLPQRLSQPPAGMIPIEASLNDIVFAGCLPNRPITLVMSANRQAAIRYILIEGFDANGQRVAVAGQTAGGGMFPNTVWPPDQWVTQSFVVEPAARYSLTLFAARNDNPVMNFMDEPQSFGTLALPNGCT